MKKEKGTVNEHVVDVRGRKSVAPKAAAGGLGLVVVAFLVSKFLGVDISGLIGGGGGKAAQTQGGGPGSAAPIHPRREEDFRRRERSAIARIGEANRETRRIVASRSGGCSEIDGT